MNNNSKVIIKRRINGTTLALAWVFLLVLPAFILNFSLNRLFKFTEDTNSRIMRSRLPIEMEIFQNDVLINHFLDREISRFFASIPKERLLDRAPTLASEFNRKTGIQPAAIIIHGPDTAKIVSNDSFPQFFRLIERIPIALTLKYFISRNKQPLLNFFETKNEIRNRSYQNDNSWKKLIKDSDKFWQRHFGLIAELPLIAEQTAQTVSAKLGGTAYFYYHPVFEGSGRSKKVRAGVMLIIRGSEIRLEKVLKSSLKATDHELVRSISFFSKDVDDVSRVNLDIKLSSFTTDLNGTHLQAPIPQSLAVHSIQKGAFFPRNIDGFRSKIPLLKVSIPKTSLEHPLKKFSSHISFFVKLLCGFGLILILRIYFYGFEIHAGVRPKVVIGILLVSFLPMTLLVASYKTWREFDRRLLQVEIENAMKSHSGLIRKNFDSYLLNLQKKTIELAADIGMRSKFGENELKEFNKDWSKNSIAQAIFLDRPNVEELVFTNDKNSCGYAIDREEDFFRKLLARIFINAGLFKKSSGDRTADFSKFKTETQFGSSSEFLNSILNSYGRLSDIVLFDNLNSYSVAKVESHDEKKFLGSVCLRYNRKRLVQDFVKEFAGKANPVNEISRFSMKNAFFTFDKELSGYKIECLSKNLKHDQMLKQLHIACQLNASFVTFDNGQPVYIDYLPRFPMLIVTGAWKPRQRENNYVSIVFLIYGFMLVIFVYSLFGKIYVEPVSKFASMANQVMQGNFNAKTSIKTGDEFEDLKNAFDSMLDGVIQKEKLFQFVSEDVVEAVKAFDDRALLPGGERLEATIIFSSIADFDGLVDRLAANELMSLLDVFISAGDRVAKATGGKLDKVIDNTLMFVYRSGANDDNHATTACHAALILTEELRQAGITTYTGISTGSVLSGRIGSYNGKLDFTVIGDAVNMAARLKEQAKKTSGTGIIIASSTIRKSKGRARVAFIERVAIKGKTRRYPIYELIGLRLNHKP